MQTHIDGFSSTSYLPCSLHPHVTPLLNILVIENNADWQGWVMKWKLILDTATGH